ncbi:MAG: GNAT family N-acetyltransferase [Nanoarchaeota archaeon]|nr:GNAT family N-acetyltransferase [Nanoarchaeota archaeon]
MENNKIPKIRLSTKEDAKTISQLICKTLEKVNKKDYTSEQINILKIRNFPDKIQEKISEGIFYCITLEDKIVGTICLKNDEIKKLYIDTNYLRKGLGYKLLKYIELVAKRKGLKKISLNSTLTAVSFYSKNKYKKISEKKFEIDGVFVPFIKMEKEL